MSMIQKIRNKNKAAKIVLLGLFIAAVGFYFSALAAITVNTFPIAPFDGVVTNRTTSSGGPFGQCFLSRVGTGSDNDGNPNHGSVCYIVHNADGTDTLWGDGYGGDSSTGCTMRCFSSSGASADVTVGPFGGGGQTSSTTATAYEACVLTQFSSNRMTSCNISGAAGGEFALTVALGSDTSSGCAMACKSVGTGNYASFSRTSAGTTVTNGGPYEYCGLIGYTGAGAGNGGGSCSINPSGSEFELTAVGSYGDSLQTSCIMDCFAYTGVLGGQCNTDGSCDAGLTCNGANTCVVAGGLNQQCYSNGTCNSPLVCNAANTCVNQLTLTSCELCVRYADSNTRNGASWRCAPMGSSVDTDFVGDVDDNDDFDVRVNCTNPTVQNSFELCRRYADSNTRDSASWQCTGFGNDLLTDFVGDVDDNDDLDFMIRPRTGVDTTIIDPTCRLGVRYSDWDGRATAAWNDVAIGSPAQTDFVGDVDYNDDFDLKIDYCSATTGVLGGQCRADGTCNAGLACSSGFCVATGGVGQQCTASGTCATGYCCAAANQCMATPSASFTVSTNTVTPPGDVTVNATASSGSGIGVSWNFGDGSPVVTGVAVATHTYQNQTTSGVTRTITLTITDACGTVRTSTQSIAVSPQPPTASFTVTPSSATTTPARITVNASASQSFTSSIVSYRWDFGEGTPLVTTAGPITSHVYTTSSPTPYVITLVVMDAARTATANRAVSIGDSGLCLAGCASGQVCVALDAGSGGQCVSCANDAQCSAGYECLGTSCAQDSLCPNGTACPLSGICAEARSCAYNGQPALNSTCPDGSACPTSGACPAAKNMCVVSATATNAECYVEAFPPASGACTSSFDCGATPAGGVCDTNAASPTFGQCKYARCVSILNSALVASCTRDSDCANGDGACDTNNGQCVYTYECAYGPGMGSGAPGRYTYTAPSAMPAMPTGVQPNGEACTKPTPDAPNNCEGINGCLYFNYNDDGTSVAGHNSVANCINQVEGGTGCVYYADGKTNCLPRATQNPQRQDRPAHAGVPIGCFVMDKGNGIKEYDCTAIDGCYYFANGAIDCTYTDGVAIGTGCRYDPNPAGAILCTAPTNPPTAGDNFVQCLLNPDAGLPSYLLGNRNGALEPCRTSDDCPVDNICIDGTCFPQCQGGPACLTGNTCPDGSLCPVNNICPSLDCRTGERCVPPPPPEIICDASSPLWNTATGQCDLTACIEGRYCPDGQLCPANGICPPTPLCAGGFPTERLQFGTTAIDIGLITTQDANCRYTTLIDNLSGPFTGMTLFNTTGLLNHQTPVSGLLPSPSLNTYYVKCEEVAPPNTITPACLISFGVGACQRGSFCPDGQLCPVNGICPTPPECDGAAVNGQPTPVTLASTVSSALISLNTIQNANCRYSLVPPNGSQSELTRYQTLSSAFSPTGGMAHSDTVSSLVGGNNTYYVLCQEAATPNDITPLCRISFNIGLCNQEYQCETGFQCAPNTGNGVCWPICENSAPSGQLDYTTAQVDLSFTTNTDASCRYAGVSSAPFDSMTPFNPTGFQTHQAFGVPVVPGPNAEYVKCREATTGNERRCVIGFDVGRSCSTDTQCTGNESCINDICVPPVCSGAYPSGQQTVNDPVDLGLNSTDAVGSPVSATCKFADTDVVYDAMPFTFSTTDNFTHVYPGVMVVSGNNTKYVKCRETALPNRETSCRIPFYGGPCSPGVTDQCEIGFGCNVLGSTCDNPLRNACIDCALCPGLPGCGITPPPPPPPCPPFCSTPPPQIVGDPQCNTLGVTFYNTAVTPLGNCSLVAIILAILSWIAWIVALLAVLSGLRAGYLYITSAGNEKTLREARAYLIYTTIGVVVAVLSFSIVAIARAFLDI